MNKVKSIINIGVLFSGLILLSGCQLAHAQEAQEKADKLIGIFATFEDLPVMEDELDLSDKISDAMIKELLNGEEVILPDLRSEGRIYAEIGPDGEHIFPIDGAALIDASYIDEEGVNVSKVDAGIGVSDLHISVSDNTREIEATLYVENQERILVIFNPVYKTSDGQIYVSRGSSLSFDSYPGARASQSLSESYTMEDNNEMMEETFLVELNIEAKEPIDYAILKSMNIADEVMDTMRISKDKLPEYIKRPEGLAYYILEEHGTSQEGIKSVQRRVIDKSEETISCMFVNANNIFEPYSIEIKESEGK